METAGWQFTNQTAPLGASLCSTAVFTSPLAGSIFGSGNVTTVLACE